MQVSISATSEVRQEATIELTQEEIQPLLEQAYEKFRPKVELRGFRKGKVPMQMVKQLYGEAIEQDALQDIASDFFRTAMNEKNIQPIGQPSMVTMDFKRGDHFHFTIKYEVKPPITLGAYKGIAVEKPVHVVTNAEVDAEIEKIRRANSTTTEVPAVTDTSHIITADVQELDATGTPLIGKKTQGAHFDLTDETLAEEIRDALASAETGQSYRVSFESQHGDHRHPVHVAISVTKVEKVSLPPFDDSLVRKITAEKTGSVEEFRKQLRADIERYWEEQALGALNDNIAKALVALHDIPVPDSIVETLLDSFVDDLRNRSRERKLPRGFDEKKFRDESREYARWQAQWLLLKERIAEEEHLAVTEAELEKLAEGEAEGTGIEKARLLQYYKSSGGAAERLLTGKIMSFLRANATITDKVVENAPQHT